MLDVFDQPVIQRCQLHKLRNVLDKLPERLRETVARRMRRAYHADSALDAEAQLSALGHELEKTHPGAAASLREGLAETLTVLALDVPPTLARTLRSTNAIESMIEICRDHSRNVKRWQDGAMVVRWCAGALQACSKPPSSSGASTATCTCPRYAPRSTDTSTPPHAIKETRRDNGPSPKFHDDRDILGEEVIALANVRGFRCFTEVGAFKQYVIEEVLAAVALVV